MNNEQEFREMIRGIIQEIIDEELNEMSTSDGAGAYNIPGAFQGNSRKNRVRKKGIATQLGMQLTPRGEKDLNLNADKLMEAAKLRYHEYKKDESASPTKKIASAISEVNRSLQEIERAVHMNSRLQRESGLAGEELYNRTRKGLLKLEARLLHLAGKIREIRGK